MTPVAACRWLLLAAVACALAPGLLAAADASPDETDDADAYEEYNEAENAFLGGPDPPCMLPCGLVVLALMVAATAVAAALGLAIAGVLLVLIVLVAGLCLAFALWFAMQGMWLAAAVAFLPVMIAAWAVVKERRRRHPPGGA